MLICQEISPISGLNPQYPQGKLTKALDAFAGDVVQIGVGGLLARRLKPRVGAQVEAVLDFPVAQGLIERFMLVTHQSRDVFALIIRFRFYHFNKKALVGQIITLHVDSLTRPV